MKARWWDDAACLGQWYLFDSTFHDDHRVAKRICQGCPVYADCLQEVVRIRADRRPLVGTWAGILFGARVRQHKRTVVAS